MEDCAVITASYQAMGQTGSIGVIGPVRMRYGHVVSVLTVVGGILGETLRENI
jgi:heat-inducible transcriptional repressor